MIRKVILPLLLLLGSIVSTVGAQSDPPLLIVSRGELYTWAGTADTQPELYTACQPPEERIIYSPQIGPDGMIVLQTWPQLVIEVLEREPELVQQLQRNVTHYLDGLKTLGFDTAKSITPIVPVMTRNDETALEMTRICRGDGLLVIPVCYPAVPMDAPRLRTCVSAIHTPEDIDFALEVLARAGRETGLIS